MADPVAAFTKTVAALKAQCDGLDDQLDAVVARREGMTEEAERLACQLRALDAGAAAKRRKIAVLQSELAQARGGPPPSPASDPAAEELIRAVATQRAAISRRAGLVAGLLEQHRRLAAIAASSSSETGCPRSEVFMARDAESQAREAADSLASLVARRQALEREVEHLRTAVTIATGAEGRLAAQARGLEEAAERDAAAEAVAAQAEGDAAALVRREREMGHAARDLAAAVERQREEAQTRRFARSMPQPSTVTAWSRPPLQLHPSPAARPHGQLPSRGPPSHGHDQQPRAAPFGAAQGPLGGQELVPPGRVVTAREEHLHQQVTVIRKGPTSATVIRRERREVLTRMQHP